MDAWCVERQEPPTETSEIPKFIARDLAAGYEITAPSVKDILRCAVESQPAVWCEIMRSMRDGDDGSRRITRKRVREAIVHVVGEENARFPW